ncbi:vesicular glutamate transporter 3-like isoform X2 [Planococcus citri]
MKFGGATLITLSTLVVSILTIFTPWIIRYNFYLYIVLRIIEGVTQIFRYVSFPEIWSRWAPSRDRSKLMSITMCGWFAGPALTYPIFGFITQKYGWPATFYCTGIFSLINTGIWFLLVTNSPTSDKWISKEELDYIQQDPQQPKPKNLKTVSKKVIMSKHYYALGIAKIVYHFGSTITVTCLPMYIKDLTGSKIGKVGVLSAIPTVVNLISIPSIGFILDHLSNTGCLTTTQVHKLFMCGAFLMGSAILLTAAHLARNFILLMACFTLLKLATSINCVLCQLNVIAIGPKCPSILAGFLSPFHVIGAAIGPLIIAFMVPDNTTSEWSKCLTVFATFFFGAALAFYIFGSSEPQNWTTSVDEQNKDDVKPKDGQSTQGQDSNYCLVPSNKIYTLRTLPTSV